MTTQPPQILDDGTNLWLNAQALVRFIFETDLEDVKEGEQRERIRHFQQRAKARMEAVALAGRVLDVQDVLEMSALEARMKMGDWKGMADVIFAEGACA